MKYRITYTCCHKTSQLEVSVFEEDFDEESLLHFVTSGIERYKEQDGLGGLPHNIIKSEISIDGDIWFATEKFMK